MRKILPLLLGCMAMVSVNAEPIAPRLRSLADAERAFAAQGARDGIQKSFLATFADDALVLKPFATSGQAWYRAHADNPGKLIWGPQYVAAAGSGELGLSSGPWRYENANGEAVAHGHFFSIWRREGDRWRVVFDHGVGHAAPASGVEATALVALGDRPAPALSAAARGAREREVAAADDALRRRLAADPATAYAGVATEATLWLRGGSEPRRGAVPPAGAKPVCGCGPRVALHVAASGDFAYGIGGAAEDRGHGVDVRVWRRQPAGAWKLLADLSDAVD